MQIAEILKSLWRLYSNENGDFQVSRGCYQKQSERPKSIRDANPAACADPAEGKGEVNLPREPVDERIPS